jgi:hypothetical protein
MAQPIWKTRDGRSIPIRDMGDSHLANSIRFLERMHKLTVLNYNPPCFQGEMAQMTADDEYNMLLESDPGDLWPIYNHLILEQQRRQRLKA